MSIAHASIVTAETSTRIGREEDPRERASMAMNPSIAACASNSGGNREVLCEFFLPFCFLRLCLLPSTSRRSHAFLLCCPPLTEGGAGLWRRPAICGWSCRHMGMLS